jgi:carboxymethylenebutenolidase
MNMAIRTSTVNISAADGMMPAYLAEPEGNGPFPAVIVIMEAFGLVPHIEEVARRLAEEGYVAMAPDIYYRELPTNKVGYDQLEQALGLMQKVDDDRFVLDMQATINTLKRQSNVNGDKIGVTGFCMGGRLTFLIACALSDQIAAAAPFYGGGITGHLSQADRITSPMYLFFGEADPYIPMDEVRQIDSRLKSLGKDYKLKSYPGADHGFFCNERASYNSAAAADAWEELKGLFAAHLRG